MDILQDFHTLRLARRVIATGTKMVEKISACVAITYQSDFRGGLP